MWQRIQTLYLALSTALIAALFFCNKAGDIPYTRYMPYVVLLAIITLALQVWLAVDFFTTGNDPVFHVTAVFPVVAVILDVLAFRNIMADELMVRSSDRLRAAKRRGR